MTRHRLVVTPLLAIGLLVTSCASRPSADELADAILISATTNSSAQVTPEQALCIANELLATNLSDTTLQGLAEDFANPTVLGTEENDVGPAVSAAALVCL